MLKTSTASDILSDDIGERSHKPLCSFYSSGRFQLYYFTSSRGSKPSNSESNNSMRILWTSLPPGVTLLSFFDPVKLINENNSRRLLFCKIKNLPDNFLSPCSTTPLVLLVEISILYDDAIINFGNKYLSMLQCRLASAIRS